MSSSAFETTFHTQAGHHADVLLVTVTHAETKAVLEVHQEKFNHPVKQIFIGNKTYFALGKIGGASTFLVQSAMVSVRPGASLQTVAGGINDLKPSAVVMVGVAFGVDDRSGERQVGDILVSRQLLLYDMQRIGIDSDGELDVRSRGDQPSASPRLLDRFR